MMRRRLRSALVALGLLTALLAFGGGAAHAAPTQETQDVGVLENCNEGCGTVHNWTDRGFHVTLNWGGAWNEENIRWVGPNSTLGAPQWTDVDGFYVGAGCRMQGTLTGPHPPWPINEAGPSWYQIHNFQTATILSHVC